MKKIFLLVIFNLAFLSSGTYSQTTIVKQDFDGTTTLGYSATGGTTYSASSGTGDRPASSPFYTSSTTGYGISSGTATLTFSNIDISSYDSKYIQFRLASFSIGSTGNGADAGDIVTVAVSVNNGGSYSNEIEIKGNTNAYWSYSGGTGNATATYDGDNTSTSFTPAGGGNRTTDGYSTVKINLADTTAQVKLKITLLNNSSNERWIIDDVEIKGTFKEPTSQSTSLNFSSITSNAFTMNWTSGNGTSRIVFLRESTLGTITDPSDGTAYTASADWGSKGTQLGSSGYYCVYNGTGSTVSLTNLSAGTTYYAYIYEYNGSGTSANYYLTDPLTGNQLTGTPSEPTLTISHAGLTEENLDGAQITLTLTNDSFVDSDLLADNFILDNEPTGVDITLVSYVSETEATLTLSYDGTDFDANVTDFAILIDQSELTEGSDLLSNSLTITATIETIPTVTIDATITTNGTSTATWNGDVTASGGEAVTQKGIVWSTSTGPTIALLTKTEEGAGTGEITGSMTGLSPNTLYYVCTYATNSVGTAYGTEKSFTTNNLGAPTTNNATSISSDSFTANWEAVSGAESYRLDVSSNSMFEKSIISESFSEFTTNNGTTDRSTSLDTYLEEVGWTGSKIYEMVGYTKLGASSAQGFIITPAIDLSSNGGVATLSFDLQKYGSDAAIIQVLHATNGSDFVQVGSDITAPASMTKQTVQITGGTAISKVKITAKSASNCRFYLDNILVYQTETLTSYGDLTVNGLSQEVTGLEANSNYYYRVRAFATTSTSDNSSTITVKTATNSQNPVVSSGSNQNVVVGNNTGVGQITFGNVTTGGNILVSNFGNAPENVLGVSGTVSNYRWIIEPNNSMVFTQEDGYKLRFEVANCPGISELEDLNANTIKLYKRSTPGSGEFTDCGFMTYHRNGSDGDQSNDYLESALITTGFSEFAFGSGSEPLPVELASLSASATTGGVVINWQTATEINNHCFIVERNINNTEWEAVGEVAGFGNSNVVRDYTFTDTKISVNGNYSYRLKQIDTDGKFEYSKTIEVVVGNLDKFELVQNYPNPFNPETKINFTVPQASNVKLVVFNALGQQVATLFNGFIEAGFHSVNFDGSNLTSGVYFYQMEAGSFKSVKKMILTK